MPTNEINLIPREDFEKKPLGRILIWALTTGRWIVIVIELVVVASFLARFKLDRDLANLYEAIRAKQAIIVNSASFEKEFRLFQKRMATCESIMANQLNAVNLISSVAGSTPKDMAFLNFSYVGNKAEITGISLSERSVRSLANGLSTAKILDEISVDSLSKREDLEQGIKFKISGVLAKEKK